MGFYDEERNVETYVEMAEGFDGRELVDVLKKHLAPGSTVLELGMGPGKDLALLAEAFGATGSDRSQVFFCVAIDRPTRMRNCSCWMR